MSPLAHIVDDDEAIRLFHVRGYLGQKCIWCDADRTAHFAADAPGNGTLDLMCQGQRALTPAVAAREAAGHLVDRQHALDMQAGFDRLDQLVVQLDIQRRSCFHETDVRAQLP